MKQQILVTVYLKIASGMTQHSYEFTDLQKAINFQQTSLAINNVKNVELLFDIEKEAENERDH
jgi:hypothetical protein